MRKDQRRCVWFPRSDRSSIFGNLTMTTIGQPDPVVSSRPPFSSEFFQRAYVRYALAVVVVGLGFLLRLPFSEEFGDRLPYVTLSPFVMLAAVLGGFGPGLLATALASLGADYWILPPTGQFKVDQWADVLGLVLFACTGVFMSAMAGLYHETRERAAAYDRQQAIRKTEERIRAIANMPPPSRAATRPQFRPLAPIGQFKFRLVLNAAFAIAIILLMTVGVAAYRSLMATREADRWEFHTDAVIGEMDNVILAIQSAEGAARGFVIFGDESFLKSYAAAAGDVDRHVTVLRALISDNPDQVRRIEAIDALIRGKLAQLQESIALRTSKGSQAAGEAMIAGQDEPKMAQIISQKKIAEQVEVGLRQQRIAAKEASATVTIRWIVIGAILGVIDLAAIFALLKYESGRRRQSEQELRIYQEHLRDLVEARTEELRASEERNRFLAELLERADQPFGVGYPDGRLGVINGAFERLTGYSREELAALDWSKVLTPAKWHDLEWAKLKELHRTGVPVRYEKEYRRKDGTVVPIELLVHLAKDEQGHALHYYTFTTDLTERKRAEEAVRESQERLQLAMASSEMASFDWDIVKNKRIWDAGVHRLFGTTPETFTGTAEEFFRVIHPDDRNAAQAALAKALDTTVYDAEYRVVWPDGSIHHIAARGRVHCDHEGRAVRLAGVCWEITARKRTEEALRRSEEQYRGMFESMLEGFCIIEVLFDPDQRPVDYRFLEINPAFEMQTGLRNAQGKRMRELAPEHEAYWFDIYGEVALTGEPARFVNEAKALNRWYDVSAYRIGGPGSRKVGILFNDITERKRAEIALQTTLRRFYHILSSMYSAVLLVTDGGAVEFANPSFCNRFGLADAPEDLTGLSAQDLIEKIKQAYLHPDEAVARIQEIVAQGQPVKGEELAMRDGGACLRDFVPMTVQGRRYGRLWIHIDISKLKQTEERLAVALAESRQRASETEAVLASINDAVLVYDTGMNVVRANPGFIPIYGFDPTGLNVREIIERTRCRALDEQPLKLEDQPTPRALRGEPVINRNLRINRQDGQERVLETTATPMRVGDRVVGTVTVWHDITDRQQIEDVLRFLGQASGTDSSGDFFQALASTLARILGMEFVCIDSLEDGLLAARTLAVFHDGNFEDNITYALKDTPCGDVVGKSVCCFPREVCRLFPKDGVLQELHAESYVGITLWSRQGKPIGLIAVIGRKPLADSRQAESILQMVGVRAAGELERRQADAALRRSEERYRNLIEMSADAIFVNRNNRIELANPAALRLFGATAAEQVLGRSPFDLFHPNNHEGIRERIRRLQSGENIVLAEERFVQADGSVRDVEIVASRVEDKEGLAVQVVLRDITERKRQEAQLRKLNRTLHALGRSSQVLVRATDEETFLQDVCRLVAKECGHAMVWIGFAEEDEARSVRVVASAGFEDGYLDTLQLTWADSERGRGPTGTAIRTATICRCAHMQTDPNFAPWREQALKRGYASSMALPLLAAGKAFGVITIYSREPDPFSDEEMKLLSGLADDLAYGITALRLRGERRRAEMAFRENEARLRALTENTPAFIFEIDRQGYIQFASQGLGGLPRERMVGTSALSWIPEGQRQRINETIAQVFDTSVAITTEYNTADGRSHLATFSPIVIGGATAVLALTAIDITERRRAEEALEQARQDLERKVNERTEQLRQFNAQLISEIAIRRAKEAELREAEFRFRTVAEFTQDWEYWETPEHTLRYCSPSCERITGYSSRELIADPELMYRIIHPEDAGVMREHRHEAFSVSRLGVIQFRIQRKDGGIRWIEHACQPVLAEGGAFLGIRAGNRDITARREAELETQRLRYELAHVTRVTTLGQLAASLAHELNQPLGAILCNAEAAQSLLAEDGGNLDEVRSALGDIIEDDQRAGQVIRRLRAMFRKEAAERQPLDVNELVRETLALLRSELVVKNVVARLDLASGLPRVAGGRVELQQVVMNLVLNAADAMAGREPGKRVIQIQTSVDGSGSVRVSVSDSGSGLPAQLIAERWEPFYTTKPNGMGMGLSIARSIIESHSGRLWAINNPDQGATFNFTLPVLPEENSA